MPVPKRKRSRARRDSRFANKFIKVKSFASCSNCQAAITSHKICGSCGYYKGRKIMATKGERTAKRMQAAEARKATMKTQGASEEQN